MGELDLVCLEDYIPATYLLWECNKEGFEHNVGHSINLILRAQNSLDPNNPTIMPHIQTTNTQCWTESKSTS